MTDAVLVRAPVGVVYRTLTDLDGWPRWLPGCRSSRVGVPRDVPGGVAGGAGERHRLVLRAGGLRRLRVVVDVDGWRHDAGVRWQVLGPGGPRTEWWLEQGPEGTVVHHVVHGEPPGRGGRRRVARHRRAAMLAMQAMKDHLELAVAVSAGRVP